MANERNTEILVREHLTRSREAFKKETHQHVWVEEQQSEKPKIQKLLQNASKAGTGAGYPDFIVTFENSNLLIVVECKAELSRHKSQTLNHYRDYAVDGALLYSSYLSKEFDVLSIGVSGEREDEWLVDTFLQIQGGSYKNLEISKLLDFGSYLSLLNRDSGKCEADEAKLKKYSQTLNQQLRDDFEFEETYRPLVVSGILLALEDEGFCSSYSTKKKPKEIAALLLNTIEERLERDNIGNMKKQTMLDTYGFLRTNTKILTERNKDGSPNTLLKDLIEEAERHIKPFTKDYKYHDILGTFYIDFLKYANGDGGLGIVLTPPHITELFCALAEVNKDSIVIDNCCGTGGFLIAAMMKMEDQVQGDVDKLKYIHRNQLIGIESNPKMFCLACSNMMLRGDGKANIYQQDCFEIDTGEIKKRKPTIAFLNPPYAKENGHKELEFVWNALSFLEPNGIGIAIVPQSCAMNTKQGNQSVKKRLLTHHTLKAVMSMPNTLFESSDKSAVTCILVFEAHKPHRESVKTWFGYWKEDGFIKMRPHGRIDYYKKYQNEVRQKWLRSYFDKQEKDGYSVLRSVEAKDEWLVEPYLKTNFEALGDICFEDAMRKYATFLFYNQLTDTVSKDCFTKHHYSLNFKDWKPITLDELFTIRGSKTTDRKVLEEQHISGERIYPYITTQATNNGARGFYDTYTEKGNVLTIDSAVFGFCAYQPFNFSASDHVEKLIPKFDMNVYRGLFLATVINQEQYRYSYGRKFNQRRIRKTEIKMPFSPLGVDWNWIENYMKNLRYSKHIDK